MSQRELMARSAERSVRASPWSTRQVKCGSCTFKVPEGHVTQHPCCAVATDGPGKQNEKHNTFSFMCIKMYGPQNDNIHTRTRINKSVLLNTLDELPVMQGGKWGCKGVN